MLKQLKSIGFKLPILSVLLVIVPICTFGQDGDTALNNYLNRIDKSIQQQGVSKKIFSAYDPSQKVKTFPDIYYEYRIESLDKNSPIKLDYNIHVKKYIDLYLEKRVEKIAEFQGLSMLYFPIFEQYLDKYGLPLELKYLPIIESGLDAKAISPSGAMGLWQLMLNSSKLLGLNVNSYIDERCDPYLATDAACRYLKYLYSIFNDWQLALAAYNGGPGEVRNAIIRSGGKTSFWEIMQYLPEQTKWYVPAYIAVVYLANNAQEHGIGVKYPKYTFQQIDTIKIEESLEFSKIQEKTGVDVEVLRFLNPMYKYDKIPDTEKSQSLVLPSDKILVFMRLENQIYSRTNDTATYFDKLLQAGDTVGKTKHLYVVGKGDFLHKIAMENACTIDNLRAWNSLKNDNLNQGQVLKIWSSMAVAEEPKYFYYTVRKGDTMWSIAERFKCDSIDNIKIANNIRDEKDLKPGQKLKIRVNN